MTIGIAIDDFDITINEADMARRARTYHRAMAVPGEAARLRTEAEAKPLKLPVNRRVDERHRSITPDGLSVWYTIQVSPHSRIYDVLFERSDRMPSDAECEAWLQELLPDKVAVEAPGLPGAFARRFDAFERDPSREAPLS